VALRRFGEPAVLRGVCRARLTVREYLDADHVRPACGARLNPGRADHHGRSFTVDRPADLGAGHP